MTVDDRRAYDKCQAKTDISRIEERLDVGAKKMQTLKILSIILLVLGLAKLGLEGYNTYTLKDRLGTNTYVTTD